MLTDTNDYERARQALTFIDSSDTDTWLKVSLCLAHEFGESGQSLYFDWSQGAPNFNETATNDAYKSALRKAAGGGVQVTLGTLFHLAGMNGYEYQETSPLQAQIAQAERQERYTQLRQNAEKIQAEEQEAKAALLERIRQKWDSAEPCESHPYATRKRAQPTGLRHDGESLLVPMRAADKSLCNLQTITVDGEKRFASLPTKGLYFSIEGTAQGPLLVCEGWATGASLNECTGLDVAVAFNAGNLPEVAKTMRGKYPHRPIIIACDDDHESTRAGKKYGEQAAQEVGALVAFPAFIQPKGKTDFNDMHLEQGSEAVTTAIQNAQHPPHLWPEPQPLPDLLPDAQAFDYTLLPEAFRGWVQDVSERMQCPPDFVAVGAITAASALIGAKARIRPKQHDSWKVTPNLWSMVIGRPGVMKSPALSEALAPLRRIETQRRAEHEEAQNAYKVNITLSKLSKDDTEAKAKKALKAGKKEEAEALLKSHQAEEESPPQLSRLIVNSANVPTLVQLMSVNPWGLLLERDELIGLLSDMDKQGNEDYRSFLLTAFDGDKPYTLDRMGTGLNQHVKQLCLSVIGSIQPGRLTDYIHDALTGGAGDDGLIQRFQLAVWPEPSKEWVNVDRWPNHEARERYQAIFDRLANMPVPEELENPIEYQFSSDAQITFNQWRATLEQRLRCDEFHPAMEAHLSKYRKLVPALSLIFHLIDTPPDSTPPEQIEEAHLLRALLWAEYLESHAGRIYSSASKSEVYLAHALLKRLEKLAKDDPSVKGFTPREIAQKNWAQFGTVELVKKAADVLADSEYLKRETEKKSTGGRPKETYLLNPRAFGCNQGDNS